VKGPEDKGEFGIVLNRSLDSYCECGFDCLIIRPVGSFLLEGFGYGDFNCMIVKFIRFEWAGIRSFRIDYSLSNIRQPGRDLPCFMPR
jgi:hypothetical protein